MIYIDTSKNKSLAEYARTSPDLEDVRRKLSDMGNADRTSISTLQSVSTILMKPAENKHKNQQLIDQTKKTNGNKKAKMVSRSLFLLGTLKLDILEVRNFR